MKKQWILIIGLAALLITAVIIASRSFPDVGQTPTTNNTQTTESSTTEETFEFDFPTVSYEEYQFEMSNEEREEYFNKFPSDDVFNAWLKTARGEYEASSQDTPTVNGDQMIDIGDYT